MKNLISTVKVVLSKLPIGDVATQYFADRGMFCAGRVPEEDLKRTMKACGGSIVVSVINNNFYFLIKISISNETNVYW